MILCPSIPEGMANWLSTSMGLILLWTVVLPPIVCQAASNPQTVSYRLHDNVPMDTIIGNVGQDADIFQGHVSRSSSMTFQLYSSLFWIHAQDGILKTRNAIDRDILCPGKADCTREINVQIRQQNNSGGAVTFVKVVLSFDDDNDNSPRFGQPEVRVSLSEGSRVGTRLLLPKATDPDSPRNGVQRYALENDLDPSGDVFSLEQTNDTGSVDVYLVLRSRLDRESVDQYRVHLAAIDGGQPSRSGVALIIIDVKDINDNIPVFDRDIYEVEVSEDVLPGTVISRVKATDQDSGLNGQIVYELDPAASDEEGQRDLFRIDGTTGEVIVHDRLDYETHPIHTIIVLARDGGGPDAIPGQVRVVVRLRNYNDNPPDIWIQSPGDSEGGRLRMSELSSPGHFLSLMTVTDGDGENTTIGCSIEDDHFRLEPLFKNEYKIVASAEVDRETHAQLTLVVTCQDDGLPVLTGSVNVTVIIDDGNDNRPIFLQDSYTIEVSEDHPLDQPILEVSATDRDAGLNGEVRYAVESGGDGFSVDARTGVVFATHALDRERQHVVSLTLTATDLGDPPLTSSASVSILIGDVDDEVPRFSQGSYTFTVTENNPPNSIVGQVHAVDVDLPPFNTVRYILLLPEITEAFRVGSDDGVLYTTRELDRELTDMERFQLLACSGSMLAAVNCSSVEVTVIVLDVNDNDPSVIYPFPWETIHIGNRFRIGDPVARIRATDPDSGDSGRVEFHVVNQTSDDCFTVDETSGEILVIGRDLAVISHATFTLHVMLSDLGSPPRHALAVINLTVNETVMTADDDARQAMMMMSGKNLVVVIIIASASGLIVVLLVVAIACLVRSLSGKKVMRQRSSPGGEVRSYLMRSDPGGRREGRGSTMMSTLQQLNPDGGMTLVSHPSRGGGKSHAVYYDRSLDDATIGHGSAFKWSAGDEVDEEDDGDEEDEMGMGSSRRKANNKQQQQQQMKRRLSLTAAAADASDSGRGSSEEVMHHSRNQQQQLHDGKLKCHTTTTVDQTFIDLKSSERGGHTSNRMTHPQQHTTDHHHQLPQQFMDAKNGERPFNRPEQTTDPCSEINDPRHHVTPSIHFRSPSIPLWNTKEDGSGRVTKKSWTETEDLCCRNHPELLVDCNVFSSDNNCGSFV